MLHHLAGRNMLLAPAIDALPAPLSTLIHGGYLAVQTFFLLSGFVLARSYSEIRWNWQSWKQFAIARFARIYPVYLLSLCIVLKFIIDTMYKPGRNPGQKAGLLVDYAFLLQGWRPNPQIGWNTPAWSLSCEFFFYLCFPVAFALLRNVRWRGITIALAISILTPVLLAQTGLPWYVKPVYHLADFIAGIAAARIFALFENRVQFGNRLYWPALSAGIWLILHPHGFFGLGDLNTALRPVNAILLVGFALGGGWLTRLLSMPLAEYLGKASYAMYIVHIPILWWWGRGLNYAGLHITGLSAAILYLATVLAASVLAFEFVETPANRRIRGWIGNGSKERAVIARYNQANVNGHCGVGRI
jgi:peptidoglycan/LPS O-acetylase OafA/YrhL